MWIASSMSEVAAANPGTRIKVIKCGARRPCSTLLSSARVGTCCQSVGWVSDIRSQYPESPVS